MAREQTSASDQFRRFTTGPIFSRVFSDRILFSEFGVPVSAIVKERFKVNGCKLVAIVIKRRRSIPSLFVITNFAVDPKR